MAEEGNVRQVPADSNGDGKVLKQEEAMYLSLDVKS